jgi:capsule synthesis protein PGA_cap
MEEHLAKLKSLLCAALLYGSFAMAAAVPTADGREEMITFVKGCATGRHITIAAVGDLLFNGSLQQFALSSKGGYRAIWQSIEPLLQGADLAYGNLEGPVANRVTFDGKLIADPGQDWRSPVYQTPTTYWSFNYHPSLIADLKRSGFKVISTANNHALDRGATGIDQTIETLERNGLTFTGTRKRHETNRAWSALVRVEGFTIAWLACTYGLNGRPDFQKQVLHCYDEQELVLGEIRRRAAEPGIDAVVLVPHWGTELSTEVEQRQRGLAKKAVNAGALLVIGAHPHMVQSWEKLTGPDNREALIIYSSGDFVSRELANPNRFGIISLIELGRSETSKAYVSAVAYVATKMDLTPAPHVVEVPSTNSMPQLPQGNRVTLARAISSPSHCQ